MADNGRKQAKDTIVISEFIDAVGLKLLADWGPVHYDPSLAEERSALKAALRSARGLIVRNRTLVNATLLAAAPRLQVVGRLGAGLDNVDLAACRRRRVEVVYSPAGNNTAVAEHTVALALALARRLPAAFTMGRAPRWQRHRLAGMELAGKKWGILGFGRVGRRLARIVTALGMTCLTYHPRKGPEHEDLLAAGVQWVPEEELWRQAHLLSVHLPLREDTYHYVNAPRLEKMRRDSLLIHVSRGGVVDEAALARGLAAGRPGAAALDVREQEPPAQPDALARLPQVILTPHCAGLTAAAQQRIARQVARDVLAVLAGRRPLYPAP